MFRYLLTNIFLILMIASTATTASELGTTPTTLKNNNHVGLNPGTPDGREGGENIGTAVLIPALPFSDTGNTSDNVHDYEGICPYGGSPSPDVVYSYTPANDEVITVDLCGSGYDTNTYILDGDLHMIACNDDYYTNEICGEYVSKIEEAPLLGGETYYIFVDGYGGDSGDYILEVSRFEIPPPCFLTCGDDEGEPALQNGYIDNWNGGCNTPDLTPFQALPAADGIGDLEFCGQGGWYINAEGGTSRDTDWFTAVVGSTGLLEWTLDSEMESYGFHLGPQDCEAVAVVDQMLAGPCEPMTMEIQAAPGEIVWLWVGSSDYEAPGGFVGHEFNYICNFHGLMEGTTSTQNISFDRIKSLYR